MFRAADISALLACTLLLLSAVRCDVPAPDITEVTTAAEFEDAMASGAKHIRITEHLDVRELEYSALCPGAEDCEQKVLFNVDEDTLSIVGDCQGAVPRAISNAVSEPQLADTRPGQCVILTRDRIFQWVDKESGTWIDNLLIRHVWPTPAQNRLDPIQVPMPNFINLMGTDSSTVWFSNVTYQGDQGGLSRAMDPWQFAELYYADCAFVDFVAEEGPVVAANTESGVYYDSCVFRNLASETSGQLLIVSNSDARIMVERGDFDGSEDPELALPSAPSGEYYTDGDFEVYVESGGTFTDANPITPSARKLFVNPSDPQYTVLRQSLGKPDPAYSPSQQDVQAYEEGAAPTETGNRAPTVEAQERDGLSAPVDVESPSERQERTRATGTAVAPSAGRERRGEASEIAGAGGPGSAGESSNMAISGGSSSAGSSNNGGSSGNSGGDGNGEDDSNVGAIIGGVVAGLVLLALLALIAGLLLFKRKRAQRTKQADSGPDRSARSGSDAHHALMSPSAAKGKLAQSGHKYASQTQEPGLSVRSGSHQSASPAYNSFSQPSQNDGGSLASNTFINTRSRGARPFAIARNVDTLGATLPAVTQRGLGNGTTLHSSVVSWCEGVEDALDEMRDANALFLGKYVVLGPIERRAGGQGVVQFMRSAHSGANFAAKFYTQREAFDSELELYMNPALQRLMPARHEVVTNDDGALVSPSGFAFPPCIILERGESLDEFARNVEYEFITVMQALSVVASKLASMHAAGWVHRDLKPGNVLRMPALHSWTLIDFGCSAQAGTLCNLMFSVSYAAPETVQQYEAGETDVQASPAVDVWALGVVAWELLTNSSVFSPGETRDSAMAKLAGRDVLPWEGSDAEVTKRLALLRRLRGSVLACLDRDPAKRPTAQQLLDSWNRFFDANDTTFIIGA